jgi:hypothetical protein
MRPPYKCALVLRSAKFTENSMSLSPESCARESGGDVGANDMSESDLQLNILFVVVVCFFG